MKQVYRIETVNGYGPYHTESRYIPFERRADAHPTPDDILDIMDMNGERIKHYYFGFATITQLKRWFRKKDRDVLAKNGYRVSKYEISDKYYYRNKTQAAFLKLEAKLVQTLDITRI
jgi:hypothetical protein